MLISFLGIRYIYSYINYDKNSNAAVVAIKIFTAEKVKRKAEKVTFIIFIEHRYGYN
jgi:hypothetical protein